MSRKLPYLTDRNFPGFLTRIVLKFIIGFAFTSTTNISTTVLIPETPFIVSPQYRVMNRPRILFLDAYDSFSNNVVSLLQTLLDADVDVLPIDSPQLDTKAPSFHDDLRNQLRCYNAVVCGPGPGSPDSEADVGLMKHIWDLEDEHILPVLGICLGFQSLAVSCGANVRRLVTGLHGMIRDIDHVAIGHNSSEGNIFVGIPSFRATLYHSLCVDIGQQSISDEDWATEKWTTPATLADILPLAWVEEPREGYVERILMGMKHATKPFWGLQYHPESICSESAGYQVVTNWFKEALRWSDENGRKIVPSRSRFATSSIRPSLLVGPQIKDSGPLKLHFDHARQLENLGRDCRYNYETLHVPHHVEVPDIVEVIQSGRQDQIILDSASAHANRIGLDVRGRYSIIALDVDKTVRFEYHVGHREVVARIPNPSRVEQCSRKSIKLDNGQTVWNVLADFLELRRLDDHNEETPFMGGFMGYITYELGLECIDVGANKNRSHCRPDLCFAWVTKSIVVDHLEGTLRIQHLRPSDSKDNFWIESVKNSLMNSPVWSDGLHLNVDKTRNVKRVTPPITPTGASGFTDIEVPDSDRYEAKVRRCQDFIAVGDSYELCLTDQTFITRSKSPMEIESHGIAGSSWAPQSAVKSPNAWQLYRSLRLRQPAPFGSYIRLGGATLISSSPERFLEYNTDGLCSMRPMKGTVRKSSAVSTLEQAEEILHIPKEEAENLMIVDLVRHDLHSVCGPGNVTVPQLLKVEEYASVFQMISVVEGRLPKAEESSSKYTGLDVLAASLPPGSMTGAPKKRSCEILQDIEDHNERSLYSGVVGYMDIAGRGDWSVTIRSLFRWDDETTRQADGIDQETWHIGAGGAVTALSTPEGEREEMFTKLKGPLGICEERY